MADLPRNAVVSEEDLQAFDLLIWFGTGRAAAEQSGINQSTITRRVARVLSAFQLSIRRQHGVHRIRGRHRDLLTLQRRVHQGLRLLGRGSLRLDVDALTWPLIQPTTLPAWHLGCADHLDPSSRIEMIRDHALDAWIGPITAHDPGEGANEQGTGLRILPLLQTTLSWPWLAPPRDSDPLKPELLTIGLMVAETHADHVSIADLCQVVQRETLRLMAQNPASKLQLPAATTMVHAGMGSRTAPWPRRSVQRTLDQDSPPR